MLLYSKIWMKNLLCSLLQTINYLFNCMIDKLIICNYTFLKTIKYNL